MDKTKGIKVVFTRETYERPEQTHAAGFVYVESEGDTESNYYLPVVNHSPSYEDARAAALAFVVGQDERDDVNNRGIQGPERDKRGPTVMYSGAEITVETWTYTLPALPEGGRS